MPIAACPLRTWNESFPFSMALEWTSLTRTWRSHWLALRVAKGFSATDHDPCHPPQLARIENYRMVDLSEYDRLVRHAEVEN
jgi:hypothetical protein